MRIGNSILMAVLSGLIVAACDRVVKSENSGAPHYEQRITSCMSPGFCMTCLPGFDGKTSCGFKFSALCPGTRDAEYMVQPTIETHESGKRTFSETLTELREVRACQ